MLLLKEEMRRTLSFLQWRADWWDGKPQGWPGATPQLTEGLRAYAHGQDVHQRDLAAHFQELWKDPLKPNEDSGTPADTDINADNHSENDDDDDDDDADEYDSDDDPSGRYDDDVDAEDGTQDS